MKAPSAVFLLEGSLGILENSLRVDIEETEGMAVVWRLL